MEAITPRIEIASKLTGDGVEIGAGHWPFPLPEAVVSVTYVSRHSPDAERELFPEVGPDHDFGHVDVLADLDSDGLRAFSSDSKDFVIASHVLEHVAAPLWALSEMLRVVRPWGFVVLVLPDRRRTFDRDRDPTSLEHVLREHQTGVREVDDLHIREFLAKTGGSQKPDSEELALHRARSVHTHCWTDTEFAELLIAAREVLQQPFSVVQHYDADVLGGTGLEFAFLLRVEDSDTSIQDQALVVSCSPISILDENARLRAELNRVYNSRTWRIGRFPRWIKTAFKR
jgi:SAM-dependent methyltransferase